ncbi:MAG: VOC family protein [Acidobacteria bacterium]|nr:VOC family protein [Acidobacteriota bacterium]
MPRLTPFLWFDTQAEEAARFYASVFPRSAVKAVHHFPEDAPMTPGAVMTVDFTLDGQDFIALNGGPMHRFNPAVSFVVNCANQAEIDHYWSALSEGGGEVECGWIRDRYGLSWQIVPGVLWEWLQSSDPATKARVLHAVWSMAKLDLAALERAYRGE